MQLETTTQFDRNAEKLAKKSLKHFNDDFNRLKTVFSKECFEECERIYHFEALQGMPKSRQFKGYKLTKVPSYDKRGKNGIRILICAEFNENACSKIYFVDIHDDPDHTDGRIKNEMAATMRSFIESKISNNPTNQA